MEDNTNLNPIGGDNTADDKKFTQEEVNNIVKNRLYKENEKLQSKFDELNQRELKADCKDFLRSENIQDYSIVDMIGYSDVEDFKNKFNSLKEYFGNMKNTTNKVPYFTSSSSNTPPNQSDQLRDAFKHPNFK